MAEIWKNIAGYEGLYEVSNLGRVRSLDRLVKGNCGSIWLRKGKILRLVLGGKGYKQVQLSKDGKRKIYYIHRLVAQAFIPNPQHFKEINHINEDKTDNRVENLEWCSRFYNINFGSRNERDAKAKSKRVAQIDKNTDEVIKIWPSTAECERNGFHHSAISDCCRGKYKTHHGYRWCYIEDSI